jgi:hypothetical protein
VFRNRCAANFYKRLYIHTLELEKGNMLKRLNFKYLLLVPIYAFYTFAVTVYLHPSIVTEKHTIPNVIGLYIR